MDGEQFFQSQWQRVIRMGADPPGFSFNTTRAPDGTPALKGVIKKGGSYSQYVMGNQLGPTGQGDHVLASFEWYTPCSGGQKWNQQNGTYIGFGVWGSADGVNTFPGGSVNEVNDVAWNFRVALSKSNTYGAYAYLPGNTGSGDFWSTGVKPSCNRWERVDLEIIQNDIGKSNGGVKLYVNCKMIRQQTGVKTRVKANVRPKGFHMLLRHNSGTSQDEAYYWRNFSLSTK